MCRFSKIGKVLNHSTLQYGYSTTKAKLFEISYTAGVTVNHNQSRLNRYPPPPSPPTTVIQ